MNVITRYSQLLFIFLLAGCGTYATPVWQATTSTPIAVAEDNVALVSVTELTAVPTDTPIPPTLIPTEAPTSVPTATVEPTLETVLSPIDRLVASRNAEDGEALFNTLQSSVGFACSTCHHVDREDQLIGPGLLNIEDRATSRVEGQSAAVYLYNSIINPNDYIVDGFTEGVMPQTWSDVYSDTEIFDIVAYLLTLEGETNVAAESSLDNATNASDTTGTSPLTALPDMTDPEHGSELFQTFQTDAGFACSTCHHADSEDRLIGPGLFNIGSRAEGRVDDQTALDYIFTSIVNPSAFVVPDFPDGLMPSNWADIYSEDELYDIVAYLLTLE